MIATKLNQILKGFNRLEWGRMRKTQTIYNHAFLEIRNTVSWNYEWKEKREKYVLIKGRIQQTLNVYKSDLSEN